jgi:hypothetical protein
MNASQKSQAPCLSKHVWRNMQFLVLLILLAMLTASFCLAILKLMWTLFAMIIREPPETPAKSRKARYRSSPILLKRVNQPRQ